jgi:hypothetical protein
MVGLKGKSFTAATLAAAGVKRISLTTSLYRAAMTRLLSAAKEVREQGTFGYIDTFIDKNSSHPGRYRRCWSVAGRQRRQSVGAGGGGTIVPSLGKGHARTLCCGR